MRASAGKAYFMYTFQFHCMDSIPLSPRVGAPCIWCRVEYLSFSLSSLISFSHVVDGSFHCILLEHKLIGTVPKGNVYKLWFMCGF